MRIAYPTTDALGHAPAARMAEPPGAAVPTDHPGHSLFISESLRRRDRGAPIATQVQGFADLMILATGLGQLDEALSRPSGTPQAVIAGEFDRLIDLVAALPLTSDEYCFAVNWIAGARECWLAGDSWAASYQLEMVRKKLAR
jgi:hypothetical protein